MFVTHSRQTHISGDLRLLLKGMAQTLGNPIRVLNDRYLGFFLRNKPAKVPVVFEKEQMLDSLSFPKDMPYVIALSDTPPAQAAGNRHIRISTYIDPEAYFSQLKRFAPGVNSVRGVFNLKYLDYIKHIKDMASAHNLRFIPYFANTYTETLRESSRLFKNINNKTDAIWISWQVLQYRNRELFKIYKEESWRYRTITFSPAANTIKKKVLFYLTPDYQKLGQTVGRLLRNPSDMTWQPDYLNDYFVGYNSNVAQHIGLETPEPFTGKFSLFK